MLDWYETLKGLMDNGSGTGSTPRQAPTGSTPSQPVGGGGGANGFNAASLVAPSMQFDPSMARGQVFNDKLGQLGAMLLSAGQRQTDSQRAQVLGGLGDVLGNTGQQMSQAYQAQLHGMQTEQLARDQQKLAQLDQQVRSNPAMLNNLGISPEQYGAIGPEGLIKVIQTNATKDPLDAEYKRAQIEHLKNPAGRTPTPQLVDLPGGGKGWATPGSSEITPIGGAGKGGTDPEMAKRTEAEDKNLTFANEAINANKVLSDPRYFTKLTSSRNEKLDMLPHFNGSWAGQDYSTGSRSANNFIDSVVRPRSGAVVGKEELENNKKIFTPTPGDTNEELFRKTQMRVQHIRSIIAGANPADRPQLQKALDESINELLKAQNQNKITGEVKTESQPTSGMPDGAVKDKHGRWVVKDGNGKWHEVVMGGGQ